MECAHLTDQQFVLYCEGRLPTDERAAVEAHLAVCSRCRCDVEMAQAAVAAFLRGETEDLPPLPAELVSAAIAHARAQFKPRD